MEEKPAERPIAEERESQPEEKKDEGGSGKKTGAGPVCYICGKTALRMCEHCRNRVCMNHFDQSTSLCTRCSAKEFGGGQLCYVCSNRAGHRCKSCGKNVCGEHYDPNLGVCVMCRIREHRESLRYGKGED